MQPRGRPVDQRNELESYWNAASYISLPLLCFLNRFHPDTRGTCLPTTQIPVWFLESGHLVSGLNSSFRADTAHGPTSCATTRLRKRPSRVLGLGYCCLFLRYTSLGTASIRGFPKSPKFYGPTGRFWGALLPVIRRNSTTSG